MRQPICALSLSICRKVGLAKSSVAGSDTLTITLTAVMYHLLRNPLCVDKLANEVRSAHAHNASSCRDIMKLPYLEACIKEGIRLVSPFGGPMPRLSPPGGMTIGESFIPEGTVICVHSQIHRDERIFRDAAAFIPERWLDQNANDLERYFLGVRPRNPILGQNW